MGGLHHSQPLPQLGASFLEPRAHALLCCGSDFVALWPWECSLMVGCPRLSQQRDPK